jgi:hypothetical protein
VGIRKSRYRHCWRRCIQSKSTIPIRHVNSARRVFLGSSGRSYLSNDSCP